MTPLIILFPFLHRNNFLSHISGEYILSSSQTPSDGELDEILLKDALQFVDNSDVS